MKRDLIKLFTLVSVAICFFVFTGCNENEEQKHVHSWIEESKIEATDYSEGLRKLKGSGCEETKTEIIPMIDPFCSSVKVLDKGSGSLMGSSGKYVQFGDWPQTIKASDVVVNEDITRQMGGFTYYKGSDNGWYVKCKEDAYNFTYTYSDGTAAATKSSDSEKYFKVEPIVWRVVTENYNGKALLVAENILTANIQFFVDTTINRYTEDGKYISPNNYEYSIIRAFLIGSGDKFTGYDGKYEGKGFLQSAFTLAAQFKILDTNLITKSKDQDDIRTTDKVFLLSSDEAENAAYGFESDSDRIRKPTDYALANHAIYSDDAGEWWLRSSYNIIWTDMVYYSGTTDYGVKVDPFDLGIVPAITLPLNQF